MLERPDCRACLVVGSFRCGASEGDLEAGAQFTPKGGQEARQCVGKQDAGDDVSASLVHGRQLKGIGGDLDDVAVLFAQSSVADEGGQSQIEELGEGASFRGVGVGEAGTVEVAEDGREALKEDALEVGIFLVRADDVGGCCKGILEARRFGTGSRSIVYVVGHGE